jgi:DNA polymerase IV
VAGRLRRAGLAGRRVTVRVRFPRMRSVTRSVTLSVAISTTLTLTEVAVGLALSALVDNEHERDITLLAVSVSNLHPEHSLQLELPVDASADVDADAEAGAAKGRRAARPTIGSVVEASRWGVDRSMDAIREKFGRTAVGYASIALSPEDRVPEQFRQLAERDPTPTPDSPEDEGSPEP